MKFPAQPAKPNELYYHIEQIVGKRVRNGRTEYCVKWEGYDWDENTWEPRSMFNKPGLVEVDKFEETLQKTIATVKSGRLKDAIAVDPPKTFEI